MGNDFLDRFEHKRLKLREAFKYSAETGSGLSSISELANDLPLEFQALGPACSGTIIAFLKQKKGPRARIGRSFFSQKHKRWLNMEFELNSIDHAQGKCYVMPPGTYAVKQTKGSIVFSASREFVPAYECFDIGKRRFYYFTAGKSTLDHEIRLETSELGGEYAGPVLMIAEGNQKRFLPFSKALHPFEAYNFFIRKSSD
mgnify:CR=1 FL=1